MKENKLIQMTELEKRVRSCTFSHDGKSLACGLTDGSFVVLSTA